MSDPALTPVLGVPGYVVLWLLALIAFTLFGWRLIKLLGILTRARPEKRWDRVVQRLALVLVNVFGQRRLLRERVIGTAHFLVFWAFVFFATAFVWNLIKGLVPAAPFPYADEVVWMTLPMEILAVLGLLGLGVAAARRYVFTPASLTRSWDASLILVLIAVLLVTFLGGQAYTAMGEGEELAWSPVGKALAAAMAGLGQEPESAAAGYLGLWWVHMVTVLGFLAYLPYSKHAHLLFGPFGVFFASLKPGEMPPGSAGATRLEEFTWRQLFSALACAECGRCDRVCPAFNSGLPLSPKEMIHELRELVLAGVAANGGGVTDVAGNGKSEAPGASTAATDTLVGERMSAEAIWACTTCLACMERCPVFNEHVPLLVEMRRYLLSQGDVGTRLQDVLMKLERYGNSFGQSARARARWTQGLEFKVKDARRQPVEYLWFVGDYASFDPRVRASTQTAARVFQRAGLDFGILYDGEQNAGTDIRRVGEEELFELLRERNLEALSATQFDAVLTTDPHTFHALKNEYENGNGWPTRDPKRVLHYTELLDRLIRRGALPLSRKLGMRVTYHDPCYLGRYNRVYEPPRRVLRELGADLVELGRNRSTAYCCGGGGGRIWMEDAPGIEERPAESRVLEAASLPGVETLVVSCPKDLVMFQDAIKSRGLEGRLAVRDLIDLAGESLGLAAASDSRR